MRPGFRLALASFTLLLAPALCRADDGKPKDAILVEIDTSGALKIDSEPFKGEVTPAALKAKFQSIRDKTDRKAIVLVSDVSKPQRASALVMEAADGAGISVKLAKPGDITASKPKPEPKPKPAAPAGPAIGFMKDVAPILVQNCIACHNPKKSEGKYVMTTFDRLKKGGARGEGITLKSGDPEESYLVELIRPDGEPRMPYKQEPLTPEKIALIERWVKEGGKYDGQTTGEDWVALLRKSTPVVIPESYPAPVPITALAFTPKGDELLASGYHELNAWKLADDSLARRVRPLPERVYEVAYSPDGKWLAAAGGDPGQWGTASVWKVEGDGKLAHARDLVESTDCLFAVAFSPDGKTLAAAGADRAIRLWEVGTWKELATIEDHADWVLDLAFSPDGKRLASASRDKTSKVFDVAKREAVATFPGHAETVYAVGFSADSKQVLSGGADGQIRVWNPDDDGKVSKNLGGFGGPVFKLQVLGDGKTLVACSADKGVHIFENLTRKRTLSGHNDWVYTFGVAPDGKTLASGSWDGEVRTWNLADGKPLKTFVAAPGYKPKVQAAAR
jgi:mono/diheme cytochrome c family protein